MHPKSLKTRSIPKDWSRELDQQMQLFKLPSFSLCLENIFQGLASVRGKPNSVSNGSKHPYAGFQNRPLKLIF